MGEEYEMINNLIKMIKSFGVQYLLKGFFKNPTVLHTNII
jgi:hypothetical protein